MNQTYRKMAAFLALSAALIGCGGGGDAAITPNKVKPKINLRAEKTQLPVNHDGLCYVQRIDGKNFLNNNALRYTSFIDIAVTHPDGSPITSGNLSMWLDREQLAGLQPVTDLDFYDIDNGCQYLTPDSSVEMNNGRTRIALVSRPSPDFTSGEVTVFARFNYEGQVQQAFTKVRIGVGGSDVTPGHGEIDIIVPQTTLSAIDGGKPGTYFEVLLKNNGAEAKDPMGQQKNLRLEIDQESALSGASLAFVDKRGNMYKGQRIDVPTNLGRANVYLRSGWLQPGQEQRLLTLTAISDDDNDITNGIQSPVRKTEKILVVRDLFACTRDDYHKPDRDPVTGAVRNPTDLKLGVIPLNQPYRSATFGKRCLVGPFTQLYGEADMLNDLPPGMKIEFDNETGMFRLVGTPNKPSRTQCNPQSDTGCNPIPVPYTADVRVRDGNNHTYTYRLSVYVAGLNESVPQCNGGDPISLGNIAEDKPFNWQRTLGFSASAQLVANASGLPMGLNYSLNGDTVIVSGTPVDLNATDCKTTGTGTSTAVKADVRNAFISVFDNNPSSPTYNSEATCHLQFTVPCAEAGPGELSSFYIQDCGKLLLQFTEPYNTNRWVYEHTIDLEDNPELPEPTECKKDNGVIAGYDKCRVFIPLEDLGGYPCTYSGNKDKCLILQTQSIDGAEPYILKLPLRFSVRALSSGKAMSVIAGKRIRFSQALFGDGLDNWRRNQVYDITVTDADGVSASRQCVYDAARSWNNGESLGNPPQNTKVLDNNTDTEKYFWKFRDLSAPLRIESLYNQSHNYVINLQRDYLTKHYATRLPDYRPKLRFTFVKDADGTSFDDCRDPDAIFAMTGMNGVVSFDDKQKEKIRSWFKGSYNPDTCEITGGLIKVNLPSGKTAEKDDDLKNFVLDNKPFVEIELPHIKVEDLRGYGEVGAIKATPITTKDPLTLQLVIKDQ